MRVLLNASNLNKGGALQASANFIIESLKDNYIDWHYAVSSELYEELVNIKHDISDLKNFYIFTNSPAKKLSARTSLKKIEKKLVPNLVFTFFGPSYVKFNAKHLLGFAEPWVTHPNAYAYNSLGGIKNIILAKMASSYKRYWVQKADYWVVEAEVAKKGLFEIINKESYFINIVQNGCRNVFYDIDCLQKNINKNSTINLLYLSAFYPHKNHIFLPEIAFHIKNKKKDLNIKFILSLDENDDKLVELNKKIDTLGVRGYFDFIGSIKLQDVPDVYKRCHIAFIPTLLEVFSATYSEAMACGMPIITSDMNFTRPICKDAAAYFPPNDPVMASQAIEKVIKDKSYRNGMVERGKVIAGSLPKSKDKYSQYISIIKSIKLTIK